MKWHFTSKPNTFLTLRSIWRHLRPKVGMSHGTYMMRGLFLLSRSILDSSFHVLLCLKFLTWILLFSYLGICMSAAAIFMMFFSPFGYSELFLCMSRFSVQGNCKDLFPFVYIVFIHITWADFLWYDWPSSNAWQIFNQNSTLYTVFPLFLLVLFLFLSPYLYRKIKFSYQDIINIIAKR